MLACLHSACTCLIQDPAVAETMSGLAEDICTGIRRNGDVHSSASRGAKSEPTSALFFTSPFMPMRFLSTVVLLAVDTRGKLWVVLDLFIRTL